MYTKSEVQICLYNVTAEFPVASVRDLTPLAFDHIRSNY